MIILIGIILLKATGVVLECLPTVWACRCAAPVLDFLILLTQSIANRSRRGNPLSNLGQKMDTYLPPPTPEGSSGQDVYLLFEQLKYNVEFPMSLITTKPLKKKKSLVEILRMAGIQCDVESP